MKLLLGLGLAQAVVPPQERPRLDIMRRLGFGGTEAEALARARRVDPVLLSACWSASSMWTANAATVSPGADAADGKVHLTPANLSSLFHRALEPEATARILQTLLPDEGGFVHHPPLPAAPRYGDEGAANHLRLCAAHGEAGLEVFVYGRGAGDPPGAGPRRHPARQTREASESVARTHRLDPGRTLLVRQNPAAIDAGAFHNDVIAVANENVLLYHAEAFAEGKTVLDGMKRGLAACGGDLLPIGIPPRRMSLADAVRTYLFNSQLVSLSGGGMCLVAPAECEADPGGRGIVEEILAGENPVREARFVPLRQSMQNGGGPACLRLRVVLTDAEWEKIHRPALLTESLYSDLTGWVERRYRDRLTPEDLADPRLIEEARAALDELTGILELGAFYPFQGTGA